MFDCGFCGERSAHNATVQIWPASLLGTTVDQIHETLAAAAEVIDVISTMNRDLSFIFALRTLKMHC